MMHSALFWLFLNFFTILVLAFYSMSEMACVSFNKIRLQYYVFEKNKRAEWLQWLLQNPYRLFCTTLIGVNVATIFGSEFAREFHSAMGLDPDLSPITQILIVLIFGELAPMFAARRYAEHVALLAVPIVYASAKVMTPLIELISAMSKAFSKLIGGREAHGNIFITQEELLKILEEQEEERPAGKGEEFNTVTTHIFNLHQKDAGQVMESLAGMLKISSRATITQAAHLLQTHPQNSDHILIYHGDHSNIVAIAHIKDLIKVPEKRRVRDYAKPPWFVTQNTPLMKLLHQIRHNGEDVAIIIDEQGKAIGAVHLDDIVQEIFGKSSLSGLKQDKTMLFLERKFPGSMKIEEFTNQFDFILDPRPELTLSELITEKLGHQPEVGESIFIGSFELIVYEISLLEVKHVFIRTTVK
jgi:putative hemolysin